MSTSSAVVATVVLRKPHRAAAKEGPELRVVAASAVSVAVVMAMAFRATCVADVVMMFGNGSGGRARTHALNRSG